MVREEKRNRKKISFDCKTRKAIDVKEQHLSNEPTTENESPLSNSGVDLNIDVSSLLKEIDPDFSDLDLSDLDPDYVPASNSSNGDSDSECSTQFPFIVTNSSQQVSQNCDITSASIGNNFDTTFQDYNCTLDVPFATDNNTHSPQKIQTMSSSMEYDMPQYVVQDTDGSCNKIAAKKIKMSNGLEVKKMCCVFCKKMYSKISRHLEQAHKNESEVARILALPKKSNQRKNQWKELTNKGNFFHNKMVLREGRGFIIPKRRPPGQINMFEYLPCQHCLGMFFKKDLWRHAKTCFASKTKERGIHHQKQGEMLMFESNIQDEEFLHRIINAMTLDKIGFSVKSDKLILQYGFRHFQKARNNPHQCNYIKQEMRQLSRLLLELKNIDSNVKNLASVIDPKCLPTIVAATRKLCKFDSKDGKYSTPSLALKIGHALKKCAIILKSDSLMNDDHIQKKKCKEFLDVFKSDWHCQISSVALSNIHLSKFNKPQFLPLTEDIATINRYIELKAQSSENKLAQKSDPFVWKELAECVLTQVMLFNRRRSGEMQRITMAQYTQGLLSGNVHNSEVLSSLSDFEKKLAIEMHRIEIQGKRGRKVPVLLSAKMKSRIDLLNKYRKSVGIKEDNPYLFANFADNTIRTSDVLRKFSNQSGAKLPEILRSTALRKHIATISQILNLKDNELDCLASFMGHDIRIHREFYRLPNETIQVAKLGKLLLEIEKGNVSEHRGKSLNEIDVSGFVDTAELGEIAESEFTENQHDFSDMETNQDVFRKTLKRNPWSPEEKQAVEDSLEKFIRLQKVPGKLDCENAKRQNAVLFNRSWRHIKFFVKNLISSEKNRLQKF